jgi:Rrf2 family protein
MLSKKAKYALQACIALAGETTSRPVLIADIAEKDGIPKKFLEIILLDLRNSGVLASRKGKGGGYFLARAPGTIMIGQIVRLMDGPLAPVPCVSQTAYQPCSDCQNEKVCGIRMVMKDVRDAIAGILDQTSLQDVLDRVKLAGANPTDDALHWVI